MSNQSPIKINVYDGGVVNVHPANPLEAIEGQMVPTSWSIGGFDFESLGVKKGKEKKAAAP